MRTYVLKTSYALGCVTKAHDLPMFCDSRILSTAMWWSLSKMFEVISGPVGIQGV